MPPWVQEGGLKEWVKRLQDPATRERVKRDGHADGQVGKLLRRRWFADRILLVGFKTEKLKPLIGKTLAEVAKLRGTSPKKRRWTLSRTMVAWDTTF